MNELGNKTTACPTPDRPELVEGLLCHRNGNSFLVVYDACMNMAVTIDQSREAIRELVARHGAANPRLFGSVLRGQSNEESDIDILVDALPGATLFDLGALQLELEELLGTPVDLLTPGDIAPAFRRRVLAEAKPL